MSKLRIWDLKELFDSFNTATQIKANIEDFCENKGLEELPKDSVVSTAILYDLAATYLAAYELLLEKSLIDNAGLKKTVNFH